jgi:Holliday junction resolvase-like predicted endonuclease
MTDWACRDSSMAEQRFCKAKVGGSSPLPGSRNKSGKMHIKTKGYIAELYVTARLIEDGWRVLSPVGENHRYDLVAEKEGVFIRIQVKYVTPKNGVLAVNCRSSNNWSVLHYSSKEIDIIAVFNSENKSIYYIPVSKINRSLFKLRINPAKNKQKAKIHLAEEFVNLN